MGGGEEEEGRDGQTHYVVEQFVAEVRPVRFPNSSDRRARVGKSYSLAKSRNMSDP